MHDRTNHRGQLSGSREELKKVASGEKTVKGTPGRKKGSGIPASWQNPAEGENRAYLTHSLTIAKLPKINTKDAEAVAQRTQEYFQLCLENDYRPTVAGYALALHCSRQQVTNWMNGNAHCPPDVLEVVMLARGIINSELEGYIIEGKLNPIAGIFLGRNNFGYTNEDHAEPDRIDALGEAQDPEELKRKYADMPD